MVPLVLDLFFYRTTNLYYKHHPGTFGNACDEIGSMTSCVEPVTLLAQSGSMIAETASMVAGSALPMTKAQARPAMTAR